jgi:hypothetical protein
MQYLSGQSVQHGDKVRVHERDARVDFIVTNEDSPSGGWFYRTLGPGVMFVIENKGLFYCKQTALANAEDIVLISRANQGLGQKRGSS